jgi:hypothetical protein
MDERYSLFWPAISDEEKKFLQNCNKGLMLLSVYQRNLQIFVKG